MVVIVIPTRPTCDAAATAKALRDDGWYLNLGDVGFWLGSASDGGRDFYWRARDSALLIRGGANYAYEQINAELAAFEQDEHTVRGVVPGAGDSSTVREQGVHICPRCGRGGKESGA